jgi:hypothetical protein
MFYKMLWAGEIILLPNIVDVVIFFHIISEKMIFASEYL